MKVREVTPEMMAEFQETVEQDFPGDQMMQEVHLARLIVQEKMRDMTIEQQVAYLNRRRKEKPDAA